MFKSKNIFPFTAILALALLLLVFSKAKTESKSFQHDIRESIAEPALPNILKISYF